MNVKKEVTANVKVEVKAVKIRDLEALRFCGGYFLTLSSLTLLSSRFKL